jgi:predicted DNA-binding transcriptional regulator AlpA
MDFVVKNELSPAFASRDAAATFAGVSKSTLRRMVESGDFPRPVYLTPSRPAFWIEGLKSWAAERARES